jgi:hypothetical protein
VRVEIDFDWTEIGLIVLDWDRIRFPVAPDAPGIYRFDMYAPNGHRIYIGETDRLRRRFQHYRTPGPTQVTNIRLNASIADLVGSDGRVTVSVITAARLTIDGVPKRLDLSYKPCRLLVENGALTAARAAGESVENL